MKDGQGIDSQAPIAALEKGVFSRHDEAFYGPNEMTLMERRIFCHRGFILHTQ